MFGDTEIYEAIAERLLSDFTLDEILEMNDLTEHDVLEILIKEAHVGQPERYFDGLETED